MPVLPAEIVAEMHNVSMYPPSSHAEYYKAMYGVYLPRKDTNFYNVSHRRRRALTPTDRNLVNNYKIMECYVNLVERLMVLATYMNSREITDAIKNVLWEMTKNATFETLSRYKPLLQFAITYYPKSVPRFFAEPFVDLQKLMCNPLANHTLRRTFQPKLDCLFGNDIKSPTTYPFGRLRDADEQQPEEIPHAVQGEIAGLDQKFRVSLDPERFIKSIRLICNLEDDLLPDVPPIYIEIPAQYPFCAPTCVIMQYDYSITPFLTSVQNKLLDYISKMPKCYSVTHILNSWEMSIRKACYFENVNLKSFSMIYESLIQ